MTTQHLNILMADDDPDDRMLVKDALEELKLSEHLDYVENGEELLDYLRGLGKYKHLPNRNCPGLILLDLNMPRKDGREALREMKADPSLRQIPVVILTTSGAIEDIQRTYDLGASSFIIKPRDFDGLVKMVQSLVKYWHHTVRLPLQTESHTYERATVANRFN
jgi:CheY-like chemotaxis protein